MTEPDFGNGPVDSDGVGDEEFRIDFTNVKARDFDPIPVGKYLVAVTDFEKRMTGEGAKNPNQPMYNFEFVVQQPEEIGAMKVAERKLWTNFMPTIETTLGILKAFLGALGDNVDGELSFRPAEILQRDFENRLLVVKVGIQPQRKSPDGSKTYEASNNIKGYYHKDTWTAGSNVAGGAVPKGGSLLP
jgi:hypothetical protein